MVDTKDSLLAETELVFEEKWSFDAGALEQHLAGDDELQVIIRGHLYIEHVLIELLKVALHRPEAIDIRRIVYPMKIDLCVALGVISDALAPPMNKVNEFRNRVAHNLNYEFTAKDKMDFFNCFPGIGRKMVLEVDEKICELKDIGYGHMIKVIIILLEVGRLNYLQWKVYEQAARKKIKSILKKDSVSAVDGDGLKT